MYFMKKLGDSGGPLYLTESNEKTTVVGITS